MSDPESWFPNQKDGHTHLFVWTYPEQAECSICGLDPVDYANWAQARLEALEALAQQVALASGTDEQAKDLIAEARRLVDEGAMP